MGESEIGEWVRGATIGKGSFGTVSLATFPSSGVFFAVKSALLPLSSSLENEKQILSRLVSPKIICYLGQDFTNENGEFFYNIFLEYLPGGTLADLVRNSGGRIPESETRIYTRSILEGLYFIHREGVVHCDIKLENILLASSGCIKIADFGLSKPAGEPSQGIQVRGTPMYMSPESVSRNEHEPPSDVWALGCAIIDMFTGKPAWKLPSTNNFNSVLFRIGFSDDLPEIPVDLSEQGRDFLRKCFVRDPAKRWSAEQLLNHPFVCLDVHIGDGFVAGGTQISPRSDIDFHRCDVVLPDSIIPDYNDYSRVLSVLPGTRFVDLFKSPSLSFHFDCDQETATDSYTESRETKETLMYTSRSRCSRYSRADFSLFPTNANTEISSILDSGRNDFAYHGIQNLSLSLSLSLSHARTIGHRKWGK